VLPLENYSIQAKNLLESIVQDYESNLKSIHKDIFYLNEIKKIRFTINSRIRKITDLAEIKNNQQDDFFTVIVFNEDYFEILNEELIKLELNTKRDGQFIKVFKKELTYNQLMSIVDDIEKIKNRTLTKCSKAKSEPVIRARTALENQFIEPAVSRETFNQCEILQKKAIDLIDLVTQKRIKEILGETYFEKYISEKI
jgi:ribosome recycling factor